MTTQILVIGSANTDMVVKTDRLPAPGETVLGGTFLMNPGGKGANQAVAAVRLMRSPDRVTFVGKVGNDLFGQQAINGFRREGLNTDYLLTDADSPSGVALINVDAAGENCIAVAPGANAHLRPEDIEAALTSAEPDAIVLIQLEIPQPTVDYVVRLATERHLRVVLNPAPARTLPPGLFQSLFLVTPNETEAEQLTGIPVIDQSTAEQAAQRLHQAGVVNVVITLGNRGAYVSTPDNSQLIAAPTVTPVDTTAAGDCFNGALCIALAEGKPLTEAVAFACRAAAISVTRLGAQTAMPYRHELDTLTGSTESN